MNLIFFASKISNEQELKHIVRTEILPFFFCIFDKFQLHLPHKEQLGPPHHNLLSYYYFFIPSNSPSSTIKNYTLIVDNHIF